MPEVKRSYWQWLVGLEKQLFLVDGTGALVSAVMIGGVLANYPAVVGMSPKVLFLLASLAVVFAVYSFSCYFWGGTRWRLFLRVIAIVIISYLALTFWLMFLDCGTLMLTGVVYFILEIVVILMLVKIELEATGNQG